MGGNRVPVVLAFIAAALALAQLTGAQSLTISPGAIAPGASAYIEYNAPSEFTGAYCSSSYIAVELATSAYGCDNNITQLLDGGSGTNPVGYCDMSASQSSGVDYPQPPCILPTSVVSTPTSCISEYYTNHTLSPGSYNICAYYYAANPDFSTLSNPAGFLWYPSLNATLNVTSGASTVYIYNDITGQGQVVALNVTGLNYGLSIGGAPGSDAYIYASNPDYNNYFDAAGITPPSESDPCNYFNCYLELAGSNAVNFSTSRAANGCVNPLNQYGIPELNYCPGATSSAATCVVTAEVSPSTAASYGAAVSVNGASSSSSNPSVSGSVECGAGTIMISETTPSGWTFAGWTCTSTPLGAPNDAECYSGTDQSYTLQTSSAWQSVTEVALFTSSTTPVTFSDTSILPSEAVQYTSMATTPYTFSTTVSNPPASSYINLFYCKSDSLEDLCSFNSGGPIATTSAESSPIQFLGCTPPDVSGWCQPGYYYFTACDSLTSGGPYGTSVACSPDVFLAISSISTPTYTGTPTGSSVSATVSYTPPFCTTPGTCLTLPNTLSNAILYYCTTTNPTPVATGSAPPAPCSGTGPDPVSSMTYLGFYPLAPGTASPQTATYSPSSLPAGNYIFDVCISSAYPQSSIPYSDVLCGANTLLWATSTFSPPPSLSWGSPFVSRFSPPAMLDPTPYTPCLLPAVTSNPDNNEFSFSDYTLPAGNYLLCGYAYTAPLESSYPATATSPITYPMVSPLYGSANTICTSTGDCSSFQQASAPTVNGIPTPIIALGTIAFNAFPQVFGNSVMVNFSSEGALEPPSLPSGLSPSTQLYVYITNVPNAMVVGVPNVVTLTQAQSIAAQCEPFVNTITAQCDGTAATMENGCYYSFSLNAANPPTCQSSPSPSCSASSCCSAKFDNSYPLQQSTEVNASVTMPATLPVGNYIVCGVYSPVAGLSMQYVTSGLLTVVEPTPPFMLPAPGIGGSGPASTAACYVYGQLQSAILVLALMMILIGAILYAGAHLISPSQSGIARSYAISMIIAGVVGALLGSSAVTIISIATNTPAAQVVQCSYLPAQLSSATTSISTTSIPTTTTSSTSTSTTSVSTTICSGGTSPNGEDISKFPPTPIPYAIDSQDTYVLTGDFVSPPGCDITINGGANVVTDGYSIISGGSFVLESGSIDTGIVTQINTSSSVYPGAAGNETSNPAAVNCNTCCIISCLVACCWSASSCIYCGATPNGNGCNGDGGSCNGQGANYAGQSPTLLDIGGGGGGGGGGDTYLPGNPIAYWAADSGGSGGGISCYSYNNNYGGGGSGGGGTGTNANGNGGGNGGNACWVLSNAVIDAMYCEAGPTGGCFGAYTPTGAGTLSLPTGERNLAGGGGGAGGSAAAAGPLGDTGASPGGSGGYGANGIMIEAQTITIDSAGFIYADGQGGAVPVTSHGGCSGSFAGAGVEAIAGGSGGGGGGGTIILSYNALAQPLGPVIESQSSIVNSGGSGAAGITCGDPSYSDGTYGGGGGTGGTGESGEDGSVIAIPWDGNIAPVNPCTSAGEYPPYC